MPLESILVFTDGASRGNPGPGGFAAVIVMPQNRRPPTITYQQPTVAEIGGREEHTTNNRMELRAAIESLSYISKSQNLKISKLTIYTDSSYLVNGITKWVRGWQKNGWRTAQKREVENRDLWEQLLNSTIYRTIEWKLVAGHAGVAGNVRCDEIATAFADGASVQLYSGPLARYPIRNILGVRGDTALAEKKGRSKARSGARAYSYVSAVGGRVAAHKTWAECERRVKGARGAKHKKVFSAVEEERLIKKWGGC